MLQSQSRATQAETAFQRSLVDYNLAMIRVNLVRGTLFDLLGVGFTEPTQDKTKYVKQAASPYAAVSPPATR